MRHRVVVVGAGIAGSLITAGLADRDELDLVCLERAGAEDHAEAGTGLNIGPNAMKCLAMHLPRSAAAITAHGLPWRRWTMSLTDGQTLMDPSLDTVADNPGIRIRWAELYALLRRPIAARIRYGAEVTGCTANANGPGITWRDVPSGTTHRTGGIDLLIAADGRYSPIRSHVLGEPETPRYLDTCLYRVLFPASPDCPIGADGVIGAAMKTPAFLEAAYRPAHGTFSREAGYPVEAIRRHAGQLHWARLQERSVAYGRAPKILLVGDSAHPMVPTLGQGATQACEDACVVVDEVRAALRERHPLAEVPQRVERRRAARVRFAAAFSREATDTMLAGADPVAGTRRKTDPAFMARLGRLYRDVPPPLVPRERAA